VPAAVTVHPDSGLPPASPPASAASPRAESVAPASVAPPSEVPGEAPFDELPHAAASANTPSPSPVKQRVIAAQAYSAVASSA
jgi:hypothetical protein